MVIKNDKTTQVFIIRIWRELHEKPGLPPELRGVIEHLQSNRRVYFKDLDAVTNFIVPYLEEMGFVLASSQTISTTPAKKRWDILRAIIHSMRGTKPHE